MSQKPTRAAVRAAGLERRLNAHNEEMGARVAEVLRRYDEQFIAPLRAEVEWLRAPLWRRVLARFRR